MELTQEEEPWEPNATTLRGVSLGESQSDVIFRMGESEVCDIQRCQWGTLSVGFLDGVVSSVLTVSTDGYQFELDKPPFTTIEEMKAILGEEDIYASSSDFLTRRYTYIEWGVSYGFSRNLLESIMIGEVRWRTVDASNGVPEYVVQGRVVCPSDDCPWNDEGVTKPEYDDKDYRVFLSQ